MNQAKTKNRGGVSGLGQPVAHAFRSPFPLAWEEINERWLDKALSEID
ncbi:hypothetical protein GTO36_02080 [bacterium]|nr:hypothetical protein [bacterium]